MELITWSFLAATTFTKLDNTQRLSYLKFKSLPRRLGSIQSNIETQEGKVNRTYWLSIVSSYSLL